MTGDNGGKDNNEPFKGGNDWFQIVNKWLGDGEAQLADQDARTHAFFRLIDSGKAEGVAAALKDDPALVHSIHHHGYTPLHKAARCNMVHIMQMLLDHGANPLALQDNQPEDITPIQVAIRFGRPEAIRFLAQNGGYDKKSDENGWTLIHHLSAEGKAAGVQALLQAGIDGNLPTDGASTPLIVALLKNQFGVAEVLLDDAAVQEGLNIHFAAADPAARTAFFLAVEKGQVALVKKMIALGADINAVNGAAETPLIAAIDAEHVDMVRLLVQKGADINIAHGSADMPLAYIFSHCAFTPKIERIISILTECGADPAVTDKNGNTLVHMLAVRQDGASYLGRAFAVSASDLVRKDADGCTALHLAVAEGCVLTAAKLLSLGADIDARTKRGETPLMLAAAQGKKAMLDLLLSEKPGLSLTDNQGRTAADYASDAGHDESAAMLRNAAAAAKKRPRKPDTGATIP